MAAAPASRYVTLSAGVAQTVTVSVGDPVTETYPGGSRQIVPSMHHLEVVNIDGNDVVYFTAGFGAATTAASAGTLPAVPTVGGNDTLVVPAVAGAALELPAGRERNLAVVRLISAGTPLVAVRAELARVERT